MCTLMCMRTNIIIDDGLMKRAQEVAGTGTKRETVDFALRELIARHERPGILGLRGKVRWEGDLERSRQGHDRR